jgi:predicted GNAT family acetyltransferase
LPTAPSGEAEEVRHNPGVHRYEILVDGRVVGFADYVDQGDRRTFTYTEIDLNLRGRGLGNHLVEAALDDTRSSGLTAVPQCGFVRAVMRSAPDTAPSCEVRRPPGTA